MRYRRLAAALLAGTIAFAVSDGTAAAAPVPKPLNTFGTGVVTATADSATIVNGPGDFGGVYLTSKSTSSKALTAVVFAFQNDGGDVGGGSPRFSLPIDTDGKANTNDGYAFIDVAGCGGVSGDTTWVSTQNPACHVNFQSVDYANWGAFAAANPTYKTGQGYIPFIIADTAGSFAIDSIVLR